MCSLSLPLSPPCCMYMFVYVCVYMRIYLCMCAMMTLTERLNTCVYMCVDVFIVTTTEPTVVFRFYSLSFSRSQIYLEHNVSPRMNVFRNFCHTIRVITHVCIHECIFSFVTVIVQYGCAVFCAHGHPGTHTNMCFLPSVQFDACVSMSVCLFDACGCFKL
jgi:hypothetical protein